MNSDNIKEYSFSCTIISNKSRDIAKFFEFYKIQMSCLLRQIASEEKDIKYLGDIDIKIDNRQKLEIEFSYDCSEDLNNSLIGYVRSFLEGNLDDGVLDWLKDPSTVCRKYGNPRNHPFSGFSEYYIGVFQQQKLPNLQFRIY
jgi:hypothetical protein